MSIALFFCGTAVFIQLILACLVLIRDHRKRANQIFSLQLFLFTLWSLAEINLLVNDIDVTGIKLLMTPGILLSYFFCIFSAIYPEYQQDAKILKSRLSIFLFSLPALALLYLLWSGRLIESFSIIHGGFTLSLGKFEFLVKGAIIGYLLYSLSTLSKSREKAETKIQMRRLRYTFTAMLLPIAAGSIIIAAGKWFIGGNTAYTFGLFPVLSIIMSSILSYTMLKYNLMEIDLIFSIGLVYTLLTAILAGAMELFQELMQDLLNFSGLWTKVISVLLIAAFFSPLKDLLIRLVDQFFGRKNFDSASVMKHILKEMRSSQKIDRMLKRLLQELKLVLEFSGCQIDIDGFRIAEQDQPSKPLISFTASLKDIPEELNEVETMADYLKNQGQPERSAELNELKNSGIRNVFRLQNGDAECGYLFLGAKTSKVPYSEAEINLVAGICNEVPHLVENLKMIEKLLVQDRSLQEIEWAKKMLDAISAPSRQLNIGELELIPFTSLSSEIKGDLIDFHKDKNGEFIGLYDAFHHGIQAVLTLNIIFSIFRSDNDTEAALKKVHQILRHFHSQNMCSAATILTAQKRSIRLTIAGNPLPIVITANEARQIEARHKTEPLGLGEKPLYESFEYELAQNEMLLIATNGLFKAFEQIANMPLLDFLNNEKFVDNSDCRDKIIARLGATSAAGFSDDITFLIAG
jgi:hypothetical protein